MLLLVWVVSLTHLNLEQYLILPSLNVSRQNLGTVKRSLSSSANEHGIWRFAQPWWKSLSVCVDIVSMSDTLIGSVFLWSIFEAQFLW